MLRRQFPLAGIACAFFAIVYATAFFPGYVSFDSAYQWWQARSGEISTINGVGIVLLWQAGGLLQDGPAPLLLFNLILFWTGAAWIAQAAGTTHARRLLLPLLLGLAPASWLLAHIWSDISLLALLLFATGALLQQRERPGYGFALLAGLACALALTQRHNAVFAVAPLLALLARADQATGAARRRRLGAAALAGLLLFGGVQLLAAQLTRVHYPVLPSLTLWDLAGMSVREQQILLPDYVIDARASLDDLASAYVPWSNTPLFASPRAGVRYPFQSWPEADLRRLEHDWLLRLAQHPRAYLAHRGELLADLFGTRPRQLPMELTYVAGPVPYKDNPPIAVPDTSLRRLALAGFDALRATAAFAAWPYLLFGLCGTWRAWRRRDALGAPALWLCASAWAYALPYAVLAPAAEFRYLAWSCAISVVLGWLGFFARTVKSAPAR